MDCVGVKISFVFLTIHRSLADCLYVEIFTDVAEGDADGDCRNLAVQSLVLLDKSLKKQLQNESSLGLD